MRSITESGALPVWRLVLPGQDWASAGQTALTTRIGGGRDRSSASWIGTLLQKAMQVPRGGWLLVTFDRGLASGLADLFAHGRLLRRTTAGRRRVIRTLRESGFKVEAEYDVWPSAKAPRIVLPRGDLAAIRWVRRSAVLGGGGRVLWKRVLARSRVMTAFARVLPPACAVLARRVE